MALLTGRACGLELDRARGVRGVTSQGHGEARSSRSRLEFERLEFLITGLVCAWHAATPSTIDEQKT